MDDNFDEFEPYDKYKNVREEINKIQEKSNKHIRESSLEVLEKDLYNITSVARLDYMLEYSIEIEYYELSKMVEDFRKNNYLSSYEFEFELEKSMDNRIRGVKILLKDGREAYNFFYRLYDNRIGYVNHLLKVNNTWLADGETAEKCMFMVPIIGEILDHYNKKNA